MRVLRGMRQGVCAGHCVTRVQAARQAQSAQLLLPIVRTLTCQLRCGMLEWAGGMQGALAARRSTHPVTSVSKRCGGLEWSTTEGWQPEC